MCARRPDDSFIRTARAFEINDLGKDNDAAAREENARLAAQIEELKAENARLLAEVESLRAAESKSLEMEAENTRLGDENARVRKQLAAAQAQAASSAAPGSPQDPQPRLRNQSINIRALQWAYAQDDLASTTKAVLVSFAIHADERGYTWPGADHIASRWGLNPTTVARQIKRYSLGG